MSKNITLSIDGKEAKVPEGTNLIEAAASVGIHIPNLCYLKGMRGIGACRLCLIDVEGGKGPVVGCITKAKEGMVVNTSTEEIQEMRKFIIDLILSMHPLDCMTCTKAGVCNLQQYAYDFEVKESSLTRKKFGYPVDEANPFIKRDPDYCVLCARCVRVCKEQGTNVLDFMGRGVGAKVATAMDKPLQESECTFCGSCVDACPVNALLEADRWRKGREWEYETSKSVCLSCGNGCDISVSTSEGAVVKVKAGGEDGSVENYICAIGRFGFDAVGSDARVTSPLIRKNGKLEEASWDDALSLAAAKLKDSKNSGIISTAGILNQDAFVLAKLASDVIKTKNIDTTASLYADVDSMKLSDQIHLDALNTIVVAGLNPSQWDRVLPALDAGVRKSVARGAKLITINADDTRLGSAATVNIKGNEATSLSQLAKALIDAGAKADKKLIDAVSGETVSEDMAKAAELIIKAENTAILCSPSLFSAARNLSLAADIKVTAVPLEANAKGVMSLGLTAKGKTFSEMASGGVDVLYAIGELPISKKPKSGFIIAQTSYMTDLAKVADVILPAAAPVESAGSIISYLGKAKDLKSAMAPAGDSKQHKTIFMELSKAMNKPVKESAAEMKKAFQVSQKAKFTAFEKKQGLDANAAELVDTLNASVINHSRLLWLKEAQPA
ncbi:MAG: molybdopterin-dependent oxidoreductase [Nitrospiraceae bacterium]|nr:MAG: molybdopterin-dependent oxidoreductase [Nitrospiraceae bacterium]